MLTEQWFTNNPVCTVIVILIIASASSAIIIGTLDTVQVVFRGYKPYNPHKYEENKTTEK